jgi:hypothetical protein
MNQSTLSNKLKKHGNNELSGKQNPAIMVAISYTRLDHPGLKLDPCWRCLPK